MPFDDGWYSVTTVRCGGYHSLYSMIKIISQKIVDHFPKLKFKVFHKMWKKSFTIAELWWQLLQYILCLLVSFHTCWQTYYVW